MHNPTHPPTPPTHTALTPPSPPSYTPTPLYPPLRYSVDWLHMGLLLPLLRSAGPTKLIADSEWHLVTDCCVLPRVRTAESGFMAVRVWFAALHGVGSSNLWYWGRSADGVPGGDKAGEKDSLAAKFVESVLAQPLMMAAYHGAVAQLQHHADAVVGIVSARRSVHVLYSQVRTHTHPRPPCPSLLLTPHPFPHAPTPAPSTHPSTQHPTQP